MCCPHSVIKRQSCGTVTCSYEDFDFVVEYAYRDCANYQTYDCTECGLFVSLRDFDNWEVLVTTVLVKIQDPDFNSFFTDPLVSYSDYEDFIKKEITTVYLNCLESVKKTLAKDGIRLF